MKVTAYIDGYNLYHAINDLSEVRDGEGQICTRHDKNYLKWLNLRKLVESYCDLKSQTLTNIYYFSAPPLHLSQSKIHRHACYIKALKHLNIIYIEGQFKKIGKKWIKAAKHTYKQTGSKTGCLSGSPY